MSILVRFLGDFTNLMQGYAQGKRGTEEFADSVEDTAASFILAARQAGRSTDDIANAVGKAFGVPFDRAKRAVEEVGDEADRTARDVDDMYRRVEDGADDVARGVGKIKDKTADVGGGLSELGSIARDALGGDVSGAAESAFGALATLGASLGVGGAIGGAVVESLGGLVSNLVNAWDPFSAKTQQVRDDVASALISMGGAFDEAAINDRLRQTAADTDKWNQAATLAKATGMDLSDALRAVAGVSQEESASAFQALQDAMNDSSSAAQNLSGFALRDLEQTLKGNSDGFSDASSRAQALSGAMQTTKADAEKASEALKYTSDALSQIPKETRASVVLRVDDSELRALQARPPVINIRARISDGQGGATLRQLIK